MCGIVGYIGKAVKIKKILAKLKNLEYRGYDSSGVAYYNDRIIVKKTVGTIDNIMGELANVQSTICISHTRWATHGEVNQTNAHPHLSYNKNFVVVHNGIVENYKKLKLQIGEDKFLSTTDTEVIANMLEAESGTTQQRFSKTINKLIGSYAILMFDKTGEKLYAAKNKSPLYVAVTPHGFLLASDITCFDGYDYYVFEDCMMATISKNTIEFFVDGKKVQPQLIHNTNLVKAKGKGNYKFFMQKEIAETPKVLQNICKAYAKLTQTEQFLKIFNQNSRFLLCGCGTAYHACLLGARWMNKKPNTEARAGVSSEIRYYGKIDKNQIVVLVSQSGETADTLAVLDKAKKIQAKVVAVTNSLHSTLATKADFVLPLCAGAEIAVASTKAYSAMLAVFYIISSKNAKRSIKKLCDFAQILNSCKISNTIIQKISNANRIFFIGRGDDAVTAQEGALKLKETSYLDSYGYYAGELKHGTIALVDHGTIIVAIATDKQTQEKTLNAVAECLSRGAEAIVVSQNKIPAGQYLLRVQNPSAPELLQISSIIKLQQLALMVADSRGTNPDRPRNLAKSVTVE